MGTIREHRTMSSTKIQELIGQLTCAQLDAFSNWCALETRVAAGWLCLKAGQFTLLAEMAADLCFGEKSIELKREAAATAAKHARAAARAKGYGVPDQCKRSDEMEAKQLAQLEAMIRESLSTEPPE
jgi:hypothetical protein